MRTGRALATGAVFLLALGGAGCLSKIATGALADALSGTGGSFGRDDDPKLVEDALPFALKTMEAVLDSQPEHRGLLGATAAAFTEYAYGFLRADAEDLERINRPAAERLRERAKKLLRRARGYGLRGLELRSHGVGDGLQREPLTALAPMTKEDIPLLYWTAAAWGAEISMDRDNMELVGDLPRVEALLRRALALDETWDDGAVHELLMSYELGRPDGGDKALELAKQHFDRANALAQGTRLSLFVSWAEGASVKRQDRKEFDALLNKVLAFPLDQKPDRTLANTIAQEQARRLKAREGDLFL